MFEIYTDEARRVIFYARYEASQFGSPYIETEHLVLGLLHQCKGLGFRLSLNDWDYESIRREVEPSTVAAPKTSVSKDLPLTMKASERWPMRQKRPSTSGRSIFSQSIFYWACCGRRGALELSFSRKEALTSIPCVREWRALRDQNLRLSRDNSITTPSNPPRR